MQSSVGKQKKRMSCNMVIASIWLAGMVLAAVFNRGAAICRDGE